MGRELPSSYYDGLFRENLAYHVHYKDSHYYVAWTQVLRFLTKIKPTNILEIGCGTGQFAEYLRDEGFTDYEGFDFSKEAIDIAKSRVEMNFYVGNALNSELYEKDFGAIVCLEVLEHIEKDLQILSNIREGTHIVFSVPNFDAPSHVRWFISPRQIKKRYFTHVQILDIVPIGALFICRGIVGKFKPNLIQRFFASREQVTLASFTVRLKHHLKNRLKLKSR